MQPIPMRIMNAKITIKRVFGSLKRRKVTKNRRYKIARTMGNQANWFIMVTPKKLKTHCSLSMGSLTRAINAP